MSREPMTIDAIYRALSAFPGVRKVCVTRTELQSFLLRSEGEMLLNGRLHDVRNEHLGAGVYRVWLEERKP